VSLEWLPAAATQGKGSTLARGTSQNGVRLYNERLALSLIRQHGSLPKAEIARLTGLSAQTVSVIVRQLEQDELLRRETPQRGKVGQPLVPFSLNPDGAFAIGLKVGRRSADLVLLDLAGHVRGKLHRPYGFPQPAGIMDFVRDGVPELLAGIAPQLRRKVAGFGIAAPFELWNWEEAAGAPRDVLESWRSFDLPGEIARLGDWQVHFSNDATAACAAELLFGKGAQFSNFAYFFVGHFIGGGVVMNGRVVPGRSGYAGSFGALPIVDPAGGTRQLLHQSSLYLLENRLLKAGLDPRRPVDAPADWSELGPLLGQWIEDTAFGLAYGAAAAVAVIDCEAVIIDGAMPPAVRARLAEETRRTMTRLDIRGLPAFSIAEGSIGADARAMGGASLALFANYMTDRDILFKESL
jgi:predicted NBD/HSP70 family sugar kinase